VEKTTTFLLFLGSVFATIDKYFMLSLETYTWKVLKCGAGEGWRSSVGPSCEN
jgi:hypothetical protein